MDHAVHTTTAPTPPVAPPLYGLLARFGDANELIAAVRQTRLAGYEAMDAFSPYPIEELAEAMDLKHPIGVSAFFLGGAALGGCGGYFMMWYTAVIDYPWVIGGKALNSWPMFIPITFELTVLGAGIVGLIGLLFLNRLPMPYHPLFKIHEFDRASQDGFFLLIEARDAKFDVAQTRRFLESLKPQEVIDVAP